MSKQAEAWAGEFGRDYTERNRVDWVARVPFWTSVLGMMILPRGARVLEVGCNAGWNLRAIRQCRKDLVLSGIDLNSTAVTEATRNGIDVAMGDAASAGVTWPRHFDLVFTAGVLIHVPTQDIRLAMQGIMGASKRYVMAIEYASETGLTEPVKYQGQANMLWRRNFGAMYEKMGMRQCFGIAECKGFDRCTGWVMERTS